MDDHIQPLEGDYLERIIGEALAEDIGHGDLTTDPLVGEESVCGARLVTRQKAVLAGLEVFRRVFLHLDPTVSFTCRYHDGDRVAAGESILDMRGRTAAILKGERTALNFLQHMSGVATRAALFMDRIRDLPVTLLDTRKTTPGLRPLEKYAVRVAGAGNHRFGLFDGILVKDNHRRLITDLPAAVATLRRLFPLRRVEIECQSLAEVESALDAGADILLLDNMTAEEMTRAVARAQGRCLLEASGNIGLHNIREVAMTGVHFISAGTIIHGATFIDISLEIGT